MELAGFRRIFLEAGEEKEVIFDIHASQMAFIDRMYQWKVEKGDIQVLAGASSVDIRLEGMFHITDDRLIDERTRSFYTIGKI